MMPTIAVAPIVATAAVAACSLTAAFGAFGTTAADAANAANEVEEPVLSGSIDAPFERAFTGPEGSTVVLGTYPVDHALVGRECRINIVAENQASVHRGNNLRLTSGDATATIEGVEDEARDLTTVSLTLVLAETITAEVEFGPDEATSFGYRMDFVCAPLDTGPVVGGLTEVPSTETPPAAAIEADPDYTG